MPSTVRRKSNVQIEVGGYKVEDAQDAPKRLAMLLWGVAGTFKTTLAATAPGKKLWLLFDDGGLDSVSGLKSQLADEHPEYKGALTNDILRIDFTHERNN